MYYKVCQYCHREFTSSRSDKRFCKSTCRHKYKYRLNLLNQKIDLKVNSIVEMEEKLKQTRQKLNNYIHEKKINLKREEKEKEDCENAIKTYNQIMSLSKEDFFSVVCDDDLKDIKNIDEKNDIKNAYKYLPQEEKDFMIASYKNKLNKKIKYIKEKYKKYDHMLFGLDLIFDDSKIKSIKEQITHIEEQILRLKQQEYKIELPKSLMRKPKKNVNETRKEQIERLKYERHNLSPKELGGADILNMNFNTYQFKGELGRFLGELDDNMVAFVLTGDSGAGKSYFSYALAKLLLSNGKTVKYYSLEEGIGKLTKEKLLHYDIGNELKITAHGTLDDVEKDAELFDAIIIDSYSKLTNNPKEFDWLRNNHPKTLFIIIFQKTTAKTIKGGAGIMYDSSATIDVKKVNGERVAKMLKGRYGTQGWVYSIDKDKIIEEN